MNLDFARIVAAIEQGELVRSKIAPPRSWTKAEQALFASLPNEAQAVISRREKERDTVVRRAQNEAADARQRSDEARKETSDLREELAKLKESKDADPTAAAA